MTDTDRQPAGSAAPYLLANHAAQAGDRFGALSACFDRTTFTNLAAVGVDAGWRCWEVGAGGPSVATWLSSRVGPAGRVVATDIDTTWLAAAPAGVEVQVHDVAADDPPGQDFDLVHCRLVLTHVPQRDRALAAMAAALAPGGWLVIEDFDVALGPAACPSPRTDDEQRANRIRAGFVALLAERGVDLQLGRSLPDRLRRLGLVDVHAVAGFPLADPAMRDLERATVTQTAAGLVAGGHATQPEIDAHLAALDHLDIASPPLVSVRARRPLPGEGGGGADRAGAGVGADTGAGDGGPKLVVVRPESDVLDRQRLDGFVGLSDRTCAAQALSMQLVIVPPGAEAQPHRHPLHETSIYVLSGQVEVRSGPSLEQHHVVEAGDFVFTPAGLVHAPRNLSATTPAYLIAARSDPGEHEQTIAGTPIP